MSTTDMLLCAAVLLLTCLVVAMQVRVRALTAGQRWQAAWNTIAGKEHHSHMLCLLSHQNRIERLERGGIAEVDFGPTAWRDSKGVWRRGLE